MLKKLLSFLSLILFTSLGFAKVHDGIEVKLSIDNAHSDNTQDIFVKVTVHNRSHENQKILKWYLPDDEGGIEDNLFAINREGEEIVYLGRHYKRPAATEGDYIVLKKNERRTYRVELSSVYDFSEAGQYQIDFNVHNFELFGLTNSADIKANKGKSPFTEMKSTTSAFIYLDKARKGKPCNPNKEDCGGGGGSGDVTFTGGCSNSEQSSIMSALNAAKNMANDSVSYLNGSAGPRYTTWFGTYTSSRWNTVAGNFDAIKDALDNKPKTFDCGCNQSYFAYVYPTQPYKVYLCRAFWQANTTGTDSKAGTIIHEISHFNVVAGTDDIVYGQSGAKNLALSDPNQAIKNADSHEYFAENTPSQN